jgi:tectonic-1/3
VPAGAGASAPLGADAATAVPVRFGENLASSCELSLSRAALRSLCPLGTAPFLGFGGMTVGSAAAPAATTPKLVGIMGNADPWKPWEWLPIALPSAPPLGSWQAPANAGVWERAGVNTGTCSGIATGLDVEFLVAPVGAVDNPQAKIVGVQATYRTGEWTYGSGAAGGGTPGGEANQTFLLTTTVTFTQVGSGAAGAAVAYKPAPPIIPPMPADIWYPFSVSASGDAGSQIFVPASGSAGVGAGAAAAALALAAVVALARGAAV